VYVSFGSVTAQTGLFPGVYAAVLEQLAALPLRVLMTVGTGGDPAALGPLPPSVHVERWWPQADVLPHAALVVGHGGFGTTQAALVAGVPQVVLPLFSFDQFANAERVEAVGVGRAVVDPRAADLPSSAVFPRGPAAVSRLGEAVVDVLHDAERRDRARALAAGVHRLPTTGDVVGTLPELVP
jgi:UDP:flavonoid glycosyltransferase YjiC (YdhE family)